jgi:hypothetical protein
LDIKRVALRDHFAIITSGHFMAVFRAVRAASSDPAQSSRHE